MKLHTHTPLVATLFVLTSLLSACNKTDSSLGQKVDGAVVSTERAANTAKAEVKEAAKEVQSAASQATSSMKTSTQDSVITTKVNAELVKDPSLSAMKINVDTSEGRVVLKGSAPSDSARARATSLASAIEGVKHVDNQLVIEVKK